MAFDFWAQREKNVHKTIFLVIIFIGILGILGFGVDRYYLGSQVPIMTILAVLVASIQSLVAFYAGDKMVLATVGAKQLDSSIPQHQQLYDVVKEMSIASGLPMPTIYVFHEDSPNAFATGRDENHSSLAVTDGLLYTMNREELQGVIAHEMAHIRNRDILTMMIVSALLGAIILLCDWARRFMFFGGVGSGGSSGGSRRKGSSGGGVLLIIFVVLIILSPILARIIAMAVSRAREYMADAGSVEFTRNPAGLASALGKIQHAADQVVDKATLGTAHLFIADPMHRSLNNQEGFFANLFSTHPPLAKRIAILKGQVQA